jgi:D-alanine-D-alanine ligase
MKDSPRIAVVMGGPSAEHEISLRSGQGVVEALTRRGWNTSSLVIPHALSVEQASERVHRALEQTGTELVFIALHGPFGEDGTVQQLCEERRLAYTGSDAEASRLGLDKVASRQRFEQIGLQVPTWRVVDPESLERAVGTLHFPVVVKPTNQGSSLGVSIATHHAELMDAIEQASRYGTRVLLEQFVRGREMTVGILDSDPLPVVEIRPKERFFDYRAKYTPGMTDYVVPALLEEGLAARVQEAGALAHQALGCQHFSRVDLILNESNQPVVLEVNTIPGLTATSLLPKAAACRGISYDELCERLVLMALSQNHRSATESQREESINFASQNL